MKIKVKKRGETGISVSVDGRRLDFARVEIGDSEGHCAMRVESPDELAWIASRLSYMATEWRDKFESRKGARR